MLHGVFFMPICQFVYCDFFCFKGVKVFHGEFLVV